MTDTTQERVTSGNVEKLAILINGRDDDLKAQVLVKLIGERFAYEAVVKVPRAIFDIDQPSIDEFFKVAKKAMVEVISGKRELNAILN